MTQSNGNIFRVTGPLCGEFTGHCEFPHKGQWRGALMFTLICVWINYWAKNREAGDLRRHRAHYGVTVMSSSALNTSVAALYTDSQCVFYSWVLRPHNLRKKNEIFDSETIGPPNSKNHNHNSKNRNHIQIIYPICIFCVWSSFNFQYHVLSPNVTKCLDSSSNSTMISHPKWYHHYFLSYMYLNINEKGIMLINLCSIHMKPGLHYNDVIMGAMASQIASLAIVYSSVYSGQRKHQSSASLPFVKGIHRDRWIPHTKGQ